MKCSRQEGMVRKGEKGSQNCCRIVSLQWRQKPAFLKLVSRMLHIILPIRYFVKSLWIQCHCILVHLNPHAPLGNRSFKGKGVGEPDSATHLGWVPLTLPDAWGLHPDPGPGREGWVHAGQRGEQSPPCTIADWPPMEGTGSVQLRGPHQEGSRTAKTAWTQYTCREETRARKGSW